MSQLQLKKELAAKIKDMIQGIKLTQAEAAVMMETTQPRVSMIMAGKIEGISLESLIDYTNLLGYTVTLNIQ